MLADNLLDQAVSTAEAQVPRPSQTALQAQVNALQSDVDSLAGVTADLESVIDSLSASVADLDGRVTALEAASN